MPQQQAVFFSLFLCTVITSRNRTIGITAAEQKTLLALAPPAAKKLTVRECKDRIFRQDMNELIPLLPGKWIDMLFLDPPYNFHRKFGETSFTGGTQEEYAEYLNSWLPRLLPLCSPTATVYICGDWRSSAAVYSVASRYLHIRNRITWERDKGRGSARNWKNNSEDIWFCTIGKEYLFQPESVKLKRRVIAPYKNEDGQPRDWQDSDDGQYRLTHPSNIWTDITVPFWSMPENTEHPTQKPEKLLAKLILASTQPGDIVFDPFLGSGTAAVTAKKLGRHFCGAELDARYTAVALKRLQLAEKDTSIQGYSDGIFWERNSQPRPGAGTKESKAEQKGKTQEAAPATSGKEDARSKKASAPLRTSGISKRTKLTPAARQKRKRTGTVSAKATNNTGSNGK